MTYQKPLDLDTILAKHNGELGVTWEDPDAVTPDTKQAILDWVSETVVGESEPLTGNGGKYPEVRNGLRAEQREILRKEGLK